MPLRAACAEGLPTGGRPYHRREPERTLLYRIVATELDALRESLVEASPYGRGLPKHVDKELEGFLRCGVLAHGFARCFCRRCKREYLVGLSCKGRGICPSCTARRMWDTAAHLVDRLLPRCPYRQWVITFPRRVRYHLAADPKLASEALRLVLHAIFAYQRRRARRLGEAPGRANSNGAVTFVQRFNSALELALHFHILIPDGVFVRDGDDPDEKPRFVDIAPPDERELSALCTRIADRVTALLRRRGRIDDDTADEPEPQLEFAARPTSSGRPSAAEPLPPLCVRQDGFSLHAGSAVHANDRNGLERLCRYGLRPALAQGRLSQTDDGTVLLEMKRQFSDGRKVIRFTPREFLLRLCALVPSPRFHMVRYAGIFAGHARGRFALCGRGMHDEVPGEAARPAPARPEATATPAQALPGVAGPPPSIQTQDQKAATPSAPSQEPQSPCQPLSPSRLGGRPADRDPDGPDDPYRQRRLDWASLIKRTFLVDVLVCPRCSGPMSLIAFIQDEHIARKILDHLGLPSRPPSRGPPARPAQHADHDPSHVDGGFFFSDL